MNQATIDELHRIIDRKDAGVRIHSAGNAQRHELYQKAFISLGYVNGHRRWTSTMLGVEFAQENPSTAQLAELGKRYYPRREMLEGDL